MGLIYKAFNVLRRINFHCKLTEFSEKFDGFYDRPTGLDGAKCIKLSNFCAEGLSPDGVEIFSNGANCFKCLGGKVLNTWYSDPIVKCITWEDINSCEEGYRISNYEKPKCEIC
jgi:hypothetical protein